MQASVWLSMSFPGISMGPMGAGGLPRNAAEEQRRYLCWGLFLTRKRILTYTHVHTHICHDKAGGASSSMILVDN